MSSTGSSNRHPAAHSPAHRRGAKPARARHGRAPEERRSRTPAEGRAQASAPATTSVFPQIATGEGARRGRRRVQRPQPVRRNLATTVAGVLGELLLTAGAVVLLFVVYTLWGTGIQTAAAQDDLRDQLSLDAPPPDHGQAEGEHPAEPAPLDQLELGDAYGIIQIPRFGDDWEWVMVEGVEDADLKNGPGHYPESVDPGQLGNFAVAAHRSGHGEPFADFPELRVGDTVEIETAEGTYVYELDSAPNGDPDGNKIAIEDTWVVDPVPGEPEGTEPTERRITLTTCWPRFGSSARMYATGILISGP